MSGCAAVGCSNRGDRGFFMKSFPRDPERRALWAFQMKRDAWQPNNNSRLCEVHFDSDQWEKTRQDGTRKLKCNAVPTLFKFSKIKTLKRKGLKRKLIIPPSENDESSASVKIEQFLEDPNIGTDEENRSWLNLDLKIKSEPEEKLLNNTHKPIPKSILRPSSILEEKNTGQLSETQSRLCNEIHKLSSFGLDAKRPKENLGEERREKTYSSSDTLRRCEFSDNQVQEIDMNKLGDTWCRLCAGRNGENYIPIFGESDLAEKMSRCLPIIIQPTDKLPLEICQQCLDSLNICHELILRSIEADLFLRSELFKTDESQGSREAKKSDSLTKEEPVFRINGPIKCDLCDDFFTDMNVFDKHIETAHLLQWRCSFCDHSFETSQELLAHKTLNHSGKIQTCENCVNSNSGDEIYRVVSGRHIGDDKKLKINSDSDRLIDNYTEVEKIESKLADLKCTKCGISFENSKEFRKHHTIHLPRRIKCSVCFKRCPSIFDYLTHIRVVHNKIKSTNFRKRNTVHGCKYCKKVLLNRQELIIHLRKHKKEMLDDPSVIVYKCVTCPKKFVDRALYQKHRNVHDPACWHKFRCYICNRSFMDKFKLKIHQSIHDGSKPYQCDVCGRMFNRNANMIRHRVKHFEQTCRHCEKTFINTQTLREHLKDIHGDTLNPKSNTKAVRPDVKKANGSNGDNYVCGYCGKQLTSYYSLLDHERIHTGDKPYVCQNCGKAFRSITARWDHMVRHEKGNYVCELCGKIMSNKLNLRRHLRKHAAIEQRRFECKECGKLFHVKWRLNAHLIRIHHSAPSN